GERRADAGAPREVDDARDAHVAEQADRGVVERARVRLRERDLAAQPAVGVARGPVAAAAAVVVADLHVVQGRPGPEAELEGRPVHERLERGAGLSAGLGGAVEL